MSASGSIASRRRVTWQPFYLVMSLVLAAIAVAGFSRTVPGDFAAPGFPAFLWLHAAVFTAWVLLFVAQPALAMAGSVRLHRRLGWLGAALACAMVVLGTYAILLALWADTLPPFYPHGLFLMRGMLAIGLFAALVAAAMANRRRAAWHKRLILCASIIVVVPGLERAMPIPLLGTHWYVVVDAVIDVIALAGPCVDLAEHRRIHPAYMWGVGAILLCQLAVDATASSGLASALLRGLGTS